MKRTNVVLDEQLLEEAVRLGGEKTYSRTIDKALRELVRQARAYRAYQALRDSGAIWEGDLAEMRGDSPRRRPRSRA